MRHHHADAYLYAYAHVYTNDYAHANKYTDIYTNAYADCYAHTHKYINAYSNVDPHAYIYTFRHQSTGGHKHSDGDDNCNILANIDAYKSTSRNQYTNGHIHPHARDNRHRAESGWHYQRAGRQYGDHCAVPRRCTYG